MCTLVRTKEVGYIGVCEDVEANERAGERAEWQKTETVRIQGSLRPDYSLYDLVKYALSIIMKDDDGNERQR